MKIVVDELKKVVKFLVIEAKKKKAKKDKEPEKDVHKALPHEYQYSKVLDYSPPLGAYNLYKNQGSSPIGPFTGAGLSVDDQIVKDNVTNQFSELKEAGSAWGSLLGEEKKTIWEEIAHRLKIKGD